MESIIVFCVSILFVLLVLFLFRSKKEQYFNNFLKITTLAFCVLGLFKFMLSDSFVLVVNGLNVNGVMYNKTDVLQTVVRWGYYLNVVVLPMAIFFNSRLFKNIASYFCLPFSILSAIFFKDFMVYYLSTDGLGLGFAEWFRYLYFSVELILAISIPILMQIKHKHIFNIKDKKEWFYYLISFPFVAFVMMPPYVPQSIIGYKLIQPTVGSSYHIIWVIVTIVLIIALYFLFRFKEYKTRYMLCVFLTLVLFYHYNSIFLMGFTIPRLPVQLCNLASYLYMIAILFKKQKLFEFCFLANVAGAIVAIILSDFSIGAFGFWNMHFLYEHSLVLMVPVLAMGLRIFPRINKSAIKYTVIGFSIYFVFCFIVGTIINGYYDVIGSKVNYFFLFDLNKAFGYFPFLTRASDVHWVFGRFEVYPIVVTIIYVAFSVFYLLIYYLAKQWYKFEDDRLDLRESAIEIYERLTNKKLDVPRRFED